jgi:hypothetical protein
MPIIEDAAPLAIIATDATSRNTMAKNHVLRSRATILDGLVRSRQNEARRFPAAIAPHRAVTLTPNAVLITGPLEALVKQSSKTRDRAYY